MPESLPSINLIKNKIPFLDKFIDWALTVGRLIIIFTEVIAVAAFIYRFSLDEKLVDLHSSIKQKQAIVSLLKQDESKYRNLQDRLSLASTFAEKGNKTIKTFKDLISLTPQEIKFNTLTIDEEKISINANVNSRSSLKEFVDLLKSYPSITSVSIDNIENKPAIGLSINITTTLKK